MRVNGTFQCNIGQDLHRDRRTEEHPGTHVAFSYPAAVVDGGYARESALSGVPTPSERVPGSAGSGNVGRWRRSLVGGALAEPLPP